MPLVIMKNVFTIDFLCKKFLNSRNRNMLNPLFIITYFIIVKRFLVFRKLRWSNLATVSIIFIKMNLKEYSIHKIAHLYEITRISQEVT